MTSYDPIGIIEKVHRLPHLNTKLQSVSNAFGISNDNYWNDYTKSLLTLPIIIAAVGVIAVLFLSLSLCLRRCFECCKCAPKENLLGDVDEQKHQRDNQMSMKKLSILLVFLAILTVISDQTIFFGNKGIEDGLNTMDNAFDFLSNTFNALEYDGQALGRLGAYLLSNATAAQASGCPIPPTVNSEISQFNTDISDFLTYIDPVPGYISIAQDSVQDYGVKNKNATIWGLYVMTVLIAVGFGLGLYCQGKLCLQYDIFFAIAFMCILIIMCCVEMIILMGVADFCISPIPYMLQVMDPSSTNYQMSYYYSTCNGTSPFAQYLDSAQTAVTFFNQNIDALVAVCPANSNVASMASELPTINTLFYDIVNSTDCPPYQEQIETVLQTGLCDTGYKGFFLIWASQYVTALLLFLLTIVASITYQYFGQYWNIEEQQEKDALKLESPVYNTNYSYYDGTSAPNSTVNKI